MKPRLFNLAAAVSLGLCAAARIMWPWSYKRYRARLEAELVLLRAQVSLEELAVENLESSIQEHPNPTPADWDRIKELQGEVARHAAEQKRRASATMAARAYYTTWKSVAAGAAVLPVDLAVPLLLCPRAGVSQENQRLVRDLRLRPSRHAGSVPGVRDRRWHTRADDRKLKGT
jgi:hypothetical protein